MPSVNIESTMSMGWRSPWSGGQPSNAASTPSPAALHLFLKKRTWRPADEPSRYVCRTFPLMPRILVLTLSMVLKELSSKALFLSFLLWCY
jgi:hypothetical protein